MISLTMEKLVLCRRTSSRSLSDSGRSGFLAVNAFVIKAKEPVTHRYGNGFRQRDVYAGSQVGHRSPGIEVGMAHP